MCECHQKPGWLILVTGIIFILMTLAGCTPPANSASWSGPGGIELRWTPAHPRFGDLVEVTADLPVEVLQDNTAVTLVTEDPQSGLFDPRGEPVFTRSIRYRGEVVMVSWAFRIVQAGTWSWGKPGTPLWTITSEAGEATDLKLFDAQGLWEGRVQPATGSGAGGQP